jgi:hypothetical protein
LPITLTINGIDGFLSGKWSLHANARVIDDETLELNADGTFQASQLNVSVSGGITVTFSNSDNSRYDIDEQNTSGIVVDHGTFFGSKTWTLNPLTTRLNIKLTNSTVGRHIFKKPILNLGVIPAPFEKKRGERMVMPVMKGKNLFNKNAPITSGNLVRADNGLLTTANGYSATDFILIKPSTPYIMSGTTLVTTPSQKGAYYDSAKNFIRAIDVFSTTSPVNAYFMRLTIPNTDFNTYQIEEGIQPTPYEPYEPYAVQVNAKPKVKVPKKNLWGGAFDLGFVLVSTNDIFTPTQGQRTTKWILCKPNTTYLVSGGDRNVWQFADSSMNRIVGVDSISATTPSNAMYMRVYYSTNGLHTQVQIEQGTQVTPYEPYKEVLPQARKGLVMDGATRIVATHSAPAEIDLEIVFMLTNANKGTYSFLWTADIGSGNYLAVRNADRSLFLSLHRNGLQKTLAIPFIIDYGIKYKVRLLRKLDGIVYMYVNDVVIYQNNVDYVGVLRELPNSNIGSFGTVTDFMIGVLYSIKLNDYFSYDLTNPNNIVADKVLQKTKNLIPGFDNGKWALHNNFNVLGKDIGRLDGAIATRSSDVYLPVKPNTTYLFIMQNNHPEARVIIRKDDGSVNYRGNVIYSGGSLITFTTDAQTTQIYVRLTNGAVGTFDFIRPQLYELTGKEGTLYGNPVSEQKAPKRVLYAKR